MLAQNKGLEELPSEVEVIELSGDETETPQPAAPQPAPAPAQQAPAVEEAPVQRGFWERFRIWLATPWSVRWRDIEK